ncbi:hypothetical protein HPT27_05325 [Permianibacter sp. IMCC34836]|uniref:hypothetical protein n=1 Tax=Permianibacter fluminis TaxID=2738515 RepID=UPI0015571FDF|nr:hypothetical protein [Permianibacter fluminis]NQD36439.1 hypothetical protein [Permianibacter fluminis]
MPSECELTLLRQFDNDGRPGLPTPPDVAAHLAGCADCRQEWAQRAETDASLRAALAVEVPVAVYRLAYQAAVQTSEPPSTLRKTFRLLFAGLVGTSCALATLMTPYLNQWVWLAPVSFATAAALTYLFEFADENKLPTL